MIIDNTDDKKKIKFETVAINPSIDPNGGYWLRLKLAQPIAEKTVFNEVAETLPIKITTFVFKTRGGIAESETQENRFDVLLKDAE